ncbi:hypothetical protein DITRI_Ditri17bG0099700 [Diplodiscus trichospermus]
MEKEIYRDCRRNHACYLGGYAIDGCSEFIPSKTLETHCKACGCHRNYHRKVLLIDLEVQSPAKGHGIGKSFQSLRDAKRVARQHHVLPVPTSQKLHQQQNSFKLRKSKFSKGQREAMREFAESLGWTMRNKGFQAEINRFCERIGVSRLVFKTWLNNNKKFYSNGGNASASGATYKSNSQSHIFNIVFDRKEREVAVIDETRWELWRDEGGSMDMHHHAIEFDMEFWPVEHPMEPQDEDRPIKCPLPASSSSINDGKGLEERVAAESWRKRTELPETAKKGISVATEPPVRAVRKRHHTLTGDDHTMKPLTRMPPLPPLPTQNVTIFQMLQEFDKFNS